MILDLDEDDDDDLNQPIEIDSDIEEDDDLPPNARHALRNLGGRRRFGIQPVEEDDSEDERMHAELAQRAAGARPLLLGELVRAGDVRSGAHLLLEGVLGCLSDVRRRQGAGGEHDGPAAPREALPTTSSRSRRRALA